MDPRENASPVAGTRLALRQVVRFRFMLIVAAVALLYVIATRNPFA